ncbi:hypothetical protein [Brevundimonas sp. M20]|uniref:hypothetical protein n=1 Tax=Brevundimonas sp. M20 TaxID=2591463 RepID=UPI00143D9850|nr:hypothetical protein [Brevundimonas sp. M20]
MTRDEQIIELAARAKAAFKELGDAIAAAAPDADKEVIADKCNAISDQIAELGAWDLP